MGDSVDLCPTPIEDDELIENLARFADGTLSEAQVKARHHLSDENWLAMGESDRLIKLVETAKLRRIRTGATKRERAQIEIIDAPPILGKIMRGADSNARHVIDAVKTLDTLASNGAEAAAAGSRFEITIVLNGDVEHYSKSIAIDANDVDPHHVDTRPKRVIADDTEPNHIDDASKNVIAAITTNKLKDNGGGEGHL